jgi:hypothetical protein
MVCRRLPSGTITTIKINSNSIILWKSRRCQIRRATRAIKSPWTTQISKMTCNIVRWVTINLPLKMLQPARRCPPINYQAMSKGKCRNQMPRAPAMKLSASLILVRYRKRIPYANRPKASKPLIVQCQTLKVHNPISRKVSYKVWKTHT